LNIGIGEVLVVLLVLAAAMAVVGVAEAADRIDDRKSNLCQHRRRDSLLHPGGHAGGESDKCCTAAVGDAALRRKGGAAHISAEEIGRKK
jgi:hypothetical protein